MPDTGWFDVEHDKTILVGPNEGGKTALLKALEQINPPDDVPRFDPLRDYPRSQLDELKIDEADGGAITPADVTVVEAHFTLEAEDEAAVVAIDQAFAGASYVVGRRLDGTYWHRIDGGPAIPTYAHLAKDLKRLAAHVDRQVNEADAAKRVEC